MDSVLSKVAEYVRGVEEEPAPEATPDTVDDDDIEDIEKEIYLPVMAQACFELIDESDISKEGLSSHVV